MSRSGGRVCVIGGGPAGLAAAIALARVGAETTVVDRAMPPIDKSCGEGLLPDSIAALRELGVELPPSAGFPLGGIRFTGGRSSVYTSFPNGKGRGVRRTVLHDLLAGEARKNGVSLIWGAKHIALQQSGVLVDGRSIAADLVVGADGQNSRVRIAAVLGETVNERRRYGFRRHYRIAPWSDGVELHWGPGCQIYITPIAADEVCVALISDSPALRLNQAFNCFPEVRARLAAAQAITPEMGAVTASRALRRVTAARVALAGDASGSVDAITGQGLCLGFQQALALAAAFRSGRLDRYQADHRALMKRPRFMASLLLAMADHDGFRSRVLSALSRRPRLFESFVAIHVGASEARALCSWRLLDFGLVLLGA
jgi:flavin-dependent dehydrogenase